MTKTTKTKNGRKLSTLVKNGGFHGYEFSYSRPVAGVKDERTYLNVSGFNPITGGRDKVRLNGKAVATLRHLLTKRN